MNNYKDLKIWQKAVAISVKIYEITKSFPTDEMYGLTSQMRRSSVSIAANIAEGSGRNSKKEFKQFLAIASGSTCELETLLLIAERTGLINSETYNTLLLTTTEI